MAFPVEADAQSKPDEPTPQEAPFVLRAVRDLKVPAKLRLCAVICLAAGLIPTLMLLFRIRPLAGGSIERQVVTSLVIWTVVVQSFGLLLALLVGRHVLRDISAALHRLWDLVRSVPAGDAGETIDVGNRQDEIGALTAALQRMITLAQEDRHNLIQGNVALVLTNERLAQTNMELEAANSKVRNLAEQAGEANLAKRSFLAVMSHEIRTPVNGIIGMAELALKTPLNAVQRDYLETVNSSAQSLLDLLNDILDFSKIEAGRLELEVVDFSLRDTLDDALAGYAARFHAKGIELILDIRSDVPDALIGDPYRLRQVVLNLVGNSLRFTDGGEVAVCVEVASADQGGTLLRFTVADTGCGIAQEKRAAVFEAFTQADNSTTRKYGGTGLGLTICRQLTHLMGGWISVQSEVGKGSEFQFRARFGVGATLQQDAGGLLKGRRVLIVDSHARCAMVLAKKLGTWGMETGIVESGDAALMHLDAASNSGKPFDILIADTFNPATGGFELARRLAENYPVAPHLILLLSAARRDEALQAPHSATQLTKPVRVRKLRAAIEAALQPVAVAAPDVAAPDPSTHPHGRQLRVLIAEDNATNQRIVRTHLESWGHLVVCAGDGVEAVAQCSEQAFDLIFMDLQMPKMDGIAATAQIRMKERFDQHVAIVALTANVMKGAREECLAAGMDGYLGKPVREHELLAAIESVVPGLRPIACAHPLAPSGLATGKRQGSGYPFDVPALLTSVNNNWNLLEALLRDSRDEDVPEQVTALSEALMEGNLKGVQRAAHAIKGVIGVFHAPAAYAAAKRLEDSAKAGAAEVLSEQASELLRAVFDLLDSLQRFLASSSASVRMAVAA